MLNLQTGWYNSCVQDVFRLSYCCDTLAVLIVSIPRTFEALLLPYFLEKRQKGELDPLDQCMKAQFVKMKTLFGDDKVDLIQDFELLPSRRPKLLFQTAGHVSGAAFYYQASDVIDPPWGTKRMFGVSMHPKYGGWFAFRGALIFKELEVPLLIRKHPIDCVSGRERRIELLENFNYNWKDYRYRDIIDWPVEDKYSPMQQAYFSVEPHCRETLILNWQAQQRTLEEQEGESSFIQSSSSSLKRH